MEKRFKPKYNIKKGDTVVVITGDDKDPKKPRKVLEVLVEESRLIVEGVNIVSRHTKPSAQNTRGGIIKKEATVHVSNLMLVDAKTGKPTRVGKKKNADGKLVRVSKKSGEEIK